jgi:ABC-type bacteriocin/lantibiotic exporter with double-glycine peptidase domain
MSDLLRMVSLLKPYWRYLGQSLLVGVLIMMMQLPGPYMTKVLVDDVYPQGDESLLWCVLILGSVITMGLGFTNLLSGYFGQFVGIRMGLDFQSRFYRHIQSLDFSFFDQRETGAIISRFDDMYQSITNVIQIANSFVMNLLQCFVFPPILLLINWKLALVSIAVLPLDTLLVVTTRKYFKSLSERLAQRSAELNARQYESLNGIRSVQALGLESNFYGKMVQLLSAVTDLQLRSALLQGGTSFVATMIRACGTFSYGIYGWTQVLEGHLSLGSYLAFSGYVGFLYGPIGNLVGLLGRVEVTRVHINRFLELYDLRPTISDDPSQKRLARVRGEIRFEGVSFSYDGKAVILRELTLTVPSGSTLALVGRSGTGKSTLAKLVPRFYDPTSGSVTIDGEDVRNLRLKFLRENVTYSLQGNSFFYGTVLENLTFGRALPESTVREAARKANIHDAIAALPEGYESRVGEQGVQLSEGERQRLVLARILLINSPIVVLDEPTSALDLESEHLAQEALGNLRRDRTLIVIAHKISTIRNADEIAVLDGGKIVEQGNHSQLIERDGLYSRMNRLTATL